MFTIGKIVLIGSCLLGAAAVGADAHIQSLQSKNRVFSDGSIGNCIVAFYEEDPEPAIISDQQALEIALNHAGVKESDTEEHMVTLGIPIDINKECYQVTMTVGDKGYEYIIDAYDGSIVKAEVFPANN